MEEAHRMADVIIYYPAKPEEYKKVTNVSIKDGVLTFYWQPYSSDLKKSIKIQTTVPFSVKEEIAS